MAEIERENIRTQTMAGREQKTREDKVKEIPLETETTVETVVLFSNKKYFEVI